MRPWLNRFRAALGDAGGHNKHHPRSVLLLDLEEILPSPDLQAWMMARVSRAMVTPRDDFHNHRAAGFSRSLIVVPRARDGEVGGAGVEAGGDEENVGPKIPRPQSEQAMAGSPDGKPAVPAGVQARRGNKEGLRKSRPQNKRGRAGTPAGAPTRWSGVRAGREPDIGRQTSRPQNTPAAPTSWPAHRADGRAGRAQVPDESGAGSPTLGWASSEAESADGDPCTMQDAGGLPFGRISRSRVVTPAQAGAFHADAARWRAAASDLRRRQGGN